MQKKRYNEAGIGNESNSVFPDAENRAKSCFKCGHSSIIAVRCFANNTTASYPVVFNFDHCSFIAAAYLSQMSYFSCKLICSYLIVYIGLFSLYFAAMIPCSNYALRNLYVYA